MLRGKRGASWVRADERLDAAIRRYLTQGDFVLDAGAGRGAAFPYDYRSLARRVVGVDVDESVYRNPNLDVGHVADLAALPFADGTFDLAFARSVFEHLDHPASVFAEVRRVLRRGGHLVFRTPNRHHYYALVARATPHRFHEWFNERRGFPRSDTFPTYYRANDRHRLARLAREAAFVVRELELIEIEPAYLCFHPLAYRAGVAYAQLVQRFELLAGLRANIIGVFEAI